MSMILMYLEENIHTVLIVDSRNAIALLFVIIVYLYVSINYMYEYCYIVVYCFILFYIEYGL